MICELKKLAWLILLWMPNDIFSQNLVLNPSFENIDSCFTNCENSGWYGTQYLQFWESPTLNNTPDLMSTCNNPSVDAQYYCYKTSAPLNWQGYQYARTGENYMGYYYGIRNHNQNLISTNNSAEYLLGKLSSRLIEGKKYCFSMFVSQASTLQLKYAYSIDSNYTNYLIVDRIGVKFFEERPFIETLFPVQLSPDIDMYPDSFELFSDTSIWMGSKSYYVALGGEQFIMIGNFYSGVNINSEFVSNLQGYWQENTSAALCYHYIDDVELIEIPDIVLSSTESEIFLGESVVLSANETAEEQVWFAEDTIVAIGTGVSVVVSPAASSTYYLRSLQCKMYSWDTVYVKVREPLPPPFEPLQLFISNTISKENFLINYTGDERPLLNMALFNSVGQLVYIQEITESTTIPTSDYAPGIYYCRIFKGSEFILTEKIVVMK